MSAPPAGASERTNVADFLARRAESAPEGLGLVDRARRARASWSELERRSGAFAGGFVSAGVAAGERELVLARPGVGWSCAIQGLWRIGAVPVLIDPGIGRASFLAACARLAPRVMLASLRGQLARRLYPDAFKSVRLEIAVGARIDPSALSLERLARGAALAPRAVRADDGAAVLFTSGATGPAKGAAYTHGNFQAQVSALRELYGIQEGDIDLACFPLFALFNAAFGIASVLPRMDFARPASCDPAEIVGALAEHRAVQSFGSPAIWKRVVGWCEAHGANLGGLRRLMIAGAPVSPRLVARARALMVNGDVHTPYGATEALPVSSASGSEIEALRKEAEGGAGTLIGRAAPGIAIELVAVSDEPLPRWSDALRAAPGAIGELCVRGAAVTRTYANEPEATALAKIAAEGGPWHRMGDLARHDASGNLWFLGRKSHRMETARGLVTPVPLENVFDLHEYVAKSAVVGVGVRGSERPMLVVEAKPGMLPRGKRLRAKLATDILRAGMWFPHCSVVEGVLFHRALPVDPRHNAKIDRLALKRWVEQQMA